MAKKKTSGKHVQSGAQGGPATGSGLNYQVDFAVLQALDKIGEALSNPLDDPQIAMEPRVVAGQRVTCWDVRTSPPDVLTEAKLRPKRDEVIEWLDRVEIGVNQGAGMTFELFYGRGAPPVLSAVERLCRIAKETAGNADEFRTRVEIERTDEVDIVLERLKCDPHRSLQLVHLAPFDQESLAREIGRCLRYMVHEQHRHPLYEMLFSKFHVGIEGRINFSVRDLMREANDRGIEFLAPQTFEPRSLGPIVAGALVILQECDCGVPTAVIAAGVGCTKDEIDQSLSQHVGHALLSREGDTWSIGRLKPAFVQNNGPAVLSSALRDLMQFIRDNRSSSIGWKQIPNAIALAKACQTDFPEQVCSIFWDLNSLLKRAGNKRVVLEVANLSLACASRTPRTERQAQAEAVALICGRSWVFQRTNRLPEARADATKSLKLGQEIGWDRNTAYCLKCIGRLFRMEAEQAAREGANVKDIIGSSVEHLRQAIDMFPRVTELSTAKRTAEVGDCYSLLGRTFLFAGDINQANDAAREAVERLTDPTEKDYADLQILLGDIAKSRGDTRAADACYNEAIHVAGDGDAEKSEIAARAWFQKGRISLDVACFERAAKIWEGLDEAEFADKAKWESAVLAKRVPPSAIDLLSRETPSVRLEVLRVYEAQLSGLGTPFRGRRSEPDARYWQSLVPEARKSVAIHHVDW